VFVTYPGRKSPPTVVVHKGNCGTTLTADAPVECDNFSFTAEFGDQTASVSSGGDVTERFEGSNKCCGRCYVDCPERPTQVAVSYTRDANEGYAIRAQDTIITPQEDSAYAECESHEQEVVFDLIDLVEDGGECDLAVCMTSDLRGFGEGFPVCSQLGYVETPEQLTPVYSELPGYDFTEERVNVHVNFSVIRTGGGNFVPLEVFTQSTWATRDAIPSLPPIRIRSTKTKTYTKPSDTDCGNVAEWQVAESESDWPKVGDRYDHTLSIGAANARGYRRICNHYDIEVEFS
jgi:hypothetical protein